MNIIFSGDRNWNNLTLIKAVMERIIVVYGSFTLIEGEARGADILSKEAAKIYAVPFKEFPADWLTYKKAAGPIRNRRMVTEGNGQAVVAFHNDIENSKGTKDMVNFAKSKKLPTIVITEKMNATELYKIIDEFCGELAE